MIDLAALIAGSLSGVLALAAFAHPNNLFALLPAGLELPDVLATFALSLSASHALAALVLVTRATTNDAQRVREVPWRFATALAAGCLLVPLVLPLQFLALDLPDWLTDATLAGLFVVVLSRTPRQQQTRALAYGLACAAFGWLVLDYPAAGNERLLPLLAGLYGVPALLNDDTPATPPAPATQHAPTHPKNKARRAQDNPEGQLKPTLAGIGAGAASVVLPAITPQLAWVVSVAAGTAPSQSGLVFGVAFIASRLAFDTGLALSGGPARSAAAQLAAQHWQPYQPASALNTLSPLAVPAGLAVLLASTALSAILSHHALKRLTRPARTTPATKALWLIALILLVGAWQGASGTFVLFGASALGVAGAGLRTRAALAAASLAAPALAP